MQIKKRALLVLSKNDFSYSTQSMLVERVESDRMRRVLFLMEVKWKISKMLRKVLNNMIKKGIRLDSKRANRINKILDNNLADLALLQKKYETETGIKIKYYNKDII